jgi:membrane protein YdbS with pleckstrin-like domain
MAKKARLIPRQYLSSDEHLVFESRPSAWLYMKSAAFSAILGLVLLVLLAWEWIPSAPEIPYYSEHIEGDYGIYIQLALGVILILLFVFFDIRWLRWSSTVYAVTDERLIKQKGILNKKYEDIPVTMVTNVDIAQSLGKRALGYGTIMISTQGIAGKKVDMLWEGVPDPLVVRSKIQEVMDIRVKPKA